MGSSTYEWMFRHIVQYGDGDTLTLPRMLAGIQPILITANGPGPYKARNLAASRATGDVLLFTVGGVAGGWRLTPARAE